MSRGFFHGNKKYAWLALALAGVAGAVLAGSTVIGYFYRYRGEAALGSQDNLRALSCFEKAAEFDGDNSETQLLLARSCRRLWRIDDMEQHLERAAKLGASRRRVERERLLAIAQAGRMDQLGGQLMGLLDDPGDDGAEICAALVAGYAFRADSDSAGAVLEGWIARFPEDPEPYAIGGQLRFSQTDWPAAVTMFRKCLALAPQRTATRLMLAQALLKMNDPAAAEPEFRRCLKELPGSVEACVGLGACLVNGGQPDEARNVLRQAIDRSPHDFEARRQLAELELSVGHAEQAAEWLEPLIKTWPEDRLLASLMARALQEAGKAADAKPYWNAADRAEVALQRVDSLMEQVKLNSSALEPRFELGVLLMKHRSREEGAGWLQSVVRMAPRHRGANQALADYYAAIGDKELAEQHRGRAQSVGEAAHAP